MVFERARLRIRILNMGKWSVISMLLFTVVIFAIYSEDKSFSQTYWSKKEELPPSFVAAGYNPTHISGFDHTFLLASYNGEIRSWGFNAVKPSRLSEEDFKEFLLGGGAVPGEVLEELEGMVDKSVYKLLSTDLDKAKAVYLNQEEALSEKHYEVR